jgi:hypothetical protein
VAYDRRWPGDFYQYGQAKAGPTEILLIAAESWAGQTQWAPA